MIFILLIIAVFFNACMDAFENENFFEGVFRGWNQNFFYKRQSWRTAKKIFGYKLDAWHLSKSAMIIAVLFMSAMPPVFSPWIDALICLAAWNPLFNLFYHVLFKIK